METLAHVYARLHDLLQSLSWDVNRQTTLTPQARERFDAERHEAEQMLTYLPEKELAHRVRTQLIAVARSRLEPFTDGKALELLACEMAAYLSEFAPSDSPPPRFTGPRVTLSDQHNVVMVDGEPIPVSDKGYKLFKVLLSVPPERYVSLSEHDLRSRDVMALPAKLVALVETQPGAGTRISPKWLA